MRKETVSPIEGIQNLATLVFVYLDASPEIDIDKIAGRDAGTIWAEKPPFVLSESAITRRASLLGSYLAFHSEATICLLRMHCQSQLCLSHPSLLSIHLYIALTKEEEFCEPCFARVVQVLLS